MEEEEEAKIIIFQWLLVHKVVHVGIREEHMGYFLYSPMCYFDKETQNYFLWNMYIIRHTWLVFPLSQASCFTTMWYIWKARCMKYFKGTVVSLAETYQQFERILL